MGGLPSAGHAQAPEQLECVRHPRSSAGYAAEVFPAKECIVRDEPGSLLRCLEETERDRGPVYEIYVGTHDDEGRTPIQIVTRKDIGSKSAS